MIAFQWAFPSFAVDELKGLKDFSLVLGMLSALPMEHNLPKCAQNCQILLKSVQKQLAWRTLKYYQNWDIDIFPQKNSST
jgi:hypothetical protein